MTRGARINRLHSSAKKQPKKNKMMVSTQTTANAKVVGPKNANDGAGARMMIFSEGANARCAPPLLLLRLYEHGPRAKQNYDAHCPMEIHGIFVMKDCETARHGAQNLTTHTSVKTPSSMRRALQEAGEDQHFDVRPTSGYPRR